MQATAPITQAIALCGSRTGLAEEQAQPVLIVESGAEFATADAVARRTVVAQHVQGHPADQSQVFRRVIVARPTGLFAKLHVQDPMLLIFDAPVHAHGGRKPISIRERAQEVATFRAGLVADDAGGFHPADGLEASPATT